MSLKTNPFSDYVPVVAHAVPEPSSPPLAEALDLIAGRIQVLHSRLEVLAARLTPILAPPLHLSADTSNCKAQQVHSEVVMQIRSHADNVDTAVELVESLLSRCEV